VDPWRRKAHALLPLLVDATRATLPRLVSKAMLLSIVSWWPTMGSVLHMAALSADSRLVGVTFLVFCVLAALGLSLLDMLRVWLDLSTAKESIVLGGVPASQKLNLQLSGSSDLTSLSFWAILLSNQLNQQSVEPEE
jgi:hypothetical protein